MKKRSKQPKNKLYLLILRSFLLLTVFVVLISSTLTYLSSERMMVERLYQSDLRDLERRRDQTDTILQVGTTMVQQIFNDLNVSYLLFSTEPDIHQETASFLQLNKYRLSIPYVESIYVYNGLTGVYHVSADRYGMFNESEDDFCDPQAAEICRGWTHSRLGAPAARWAQIRTASGVKRIPLYTFSYSNVYWGGDKSIVLLNFTTDWLSQASGIAGDETGCTLILDHEGLTVSNSSAYPMAAELSREAFYQEMGRRGMDSGYFTAQVQGEKRLITYISGGESGWRYVKMTPYRLIRDEIRPVRRLVFLVDAVVLAFCLLTVFFLSRRVYVPIGRVNDKLSDLEEENRGIRRLKSQHIRRNYLTGNGDEEKARREMGTPTRDGEEVRVVLICLDHFKDRKARYTPQEISLDFYSIMNVAEEIFGTEYGAAAVGFEDEGRAALLLTRPEGGPELDPEELRPLLNRLQEAIRNILDLSLSFVISGSGQGFQSAPRLYHQAQQTVFHQIFHEDGNILLADNLAEYFAKDYTYPVKKEEMLVAAIRSGQEGQAREQVRRILEETREQSFAVLNLVTARLTLTLDNVRSAADPAGQEEAAPSDFLNIHAVERLSEIEDYFDDRIHQAVVCYDKKHRARNTELTDRVNRIIQENYADNGLCLDSIAQTVEMSSAYLGRLYKAQTMKSVADAITEVRLARAKELLAGEPDTSITEIAQLTGFTSISYFSRIFRRENGITPNEYRRREIQRQQEGK